MDALYIQITNSHNHSLEYAQPGDAGMDLRASANITLEPGEITPVGTGISMAIPGGFLGAVVPRSGAASRGLGVANSPGIVDSGYRGEIKVLAHNMSAEPISIEAGDRIAQIVFLPHAYARISDNGLPLPPTPRGEDGFGSTGVR